MALVSLLYQNSRTFDRREQCAWLSRIGLVLSSITVFDSCFFWHLPGCSWLIRARVSHGAGLRHWQTRCLAGRLIDNFAHAFADLWFIWGGARAELHNLKQGVFVLTVGMLVFERSNLAKRDPLLKLNAVCLKLKPTHPSAWATVSTDTTT